MNIVNDLNLSLNLIFQGQEIMIPTLKVPALSIETINLLGVNTLENPIDLNSFSGKINDMKENLFFRNEIEFQVLASLCVGCLAAIVLAIIGIALPILVLDISFSAFAMFCGVAGCGVAGIVFMCFAGPIAQNHVEKEASLNLGKAIDFFLENDRAEKLLQKKCLSEPNNIDLQNALKELQKVLKFYSKYAKMRAPCISSASKEILRQKSIDLDLEHDGFELTASVNSAWEKLSDSIQELKSYEKHHIYYKIIRLAPLTLLVGAVALGTFSLNLLSIGAGVIALYFAIRGFLEGTILEEDVKAKRLDVEQTTSILKTFFSKDFQDLKEDLELEIAKDTEDKPRLKKALRELDMAITYYTELPEPEQKIEQDWMFSSILNWCRRGVNFISAS